MKFSSSKAKIRKQKLKEVAGNSKWRINNSLDKMYEPRSADDIVDEALGQVGNVMEYSVTRENCEHFATKMRYGKAVSFQVSDPFFCGCGENREGLIMLDWNKTLYLPEL